MKWLVQEELDPEPGIVALSCPYCSYIDRRWTREELIGSTVGCIGCGVSSKHPTERELQRGTEQ